MRTITVVVLAGGVAGLVVVAAATGPRPFYSGVAESVAFAPPFSPTPAEQAIANARARIEKNPARPEGHNELAMAQARRARETADPSFYHQAMSALAEARRLAPGNFESDKVGI